MLDQVYWQSSDLPFTLSWLLFELLSSHLLTNWNFPPSPSRYFCTYLTREIMISLSSRDSLSLSHSHQMHTIHLLIPSSISDFSFTHSFIPCPSIFSMTIIIIFLCIPSSYSLSHPLSLTLFLHPYLISYFLPLLLKSGHETFFQI